jgi:hypothetical protein
VTESGRTTSEIGARAEMAVTAALLRADRPVYLPFFNAHGRVDLIYEATDGEFRRVQCKAARVVNDVMLFHTCSQTGGVDRGYLGDIDEFGVYCEETGCVYLVPVTDVPARLASLRLTRPRNNQLRGVRWAEPYVLGPPW